MTDAGNQYLELLEQRVALLGALGREFVDCRPAFVAMDLDRIYGHIGAQEELCRRIRSADSAMVALAGLAARRLVQPVRPPADDPATERFRGALAKLREAEKEVRQLARIHAAYLRRCRRTIDLFSNFIRSHGLTYTQPARAGSAAEAFAGGL